LKKRKDLGSVVEHSGSINSLAFFQNSHLLTASDDGKVALFRTSDWECLHVFPHKAPVSSTAIHPSGKLAISVSGKQKSLRLWNLVTGKAAGRGKTARPVDSVLWSPTGSHYALQSENMVQVFSASSTKEPWVEIESASRILTSAFLDDQTICLAGEGSNLQILRMTESGSVAWKKTLGLGQSPRIKALSVVEGGLLISIASEGSLCFWQVSHLLDAQEDQSVHPLAKHTILGLRPICMTASVQ